MTSTKIKRMKTAASEWMGADLEMSRLWQAHGLLLEQRKRLRKSLLTHYRANEINLCKLFQGTTPEQRKVVENYLLVKAWLAAGE